MRILISFALLIFVSVCAFLACEKDDGTGVTPPQPIPPVLNKAPVANAGADMSLPLASCNDVTNADLDGSGSSDPDGHAITYRWIKISGPENFRLVNATAAKARLENIGAGEYAFELMVNDQFGLFSRDTVRLSVKGTPKEYDLDLAANGTFFFFNNELDYYSCYYGPCTYYDRVDIQTNGSFAPLGTFNVFVSELNDTAATRYATESYINIYQSNVNRYSLYGTSSVNFKKLYQQGGGAFSGTYKVNGGSAQMCKDTIFANLSALTLTGTLDTATSKVTLRIAGKTYF
jgi:hypothetical protein